MDLGERLQRRECHRGIWHAGRSRCGERARRTAGAATWNDGSGNLWLFGGYWQNADGSSYSFFNDLWKYSPSSGEWTWVGGSSTPAGAQGVYGTEGVAAVANVPGARVTSATWKDDAGNVWLFGGDGPGVEMNDLWKYPAQ